MKKVAVVTATRAEYGILKPLLARLVKEPEMILQLLVTGTHLSEKYGRTETEIIKDGFEIYQRISIFDMCVSGGVQHMTYHVRWQMH